MLYLITLEKILNLIAAIFTTKILSLILKYSTSDLTVIIVHVHDCYAYVCLYCSEFLKPQF